MGAVVFWVLVAAVVIASVIATVLSRRRRGQRLEAMLSTPGAAGVSQHTGAEGMRGVSPTLGGQSPTLPPTA